MQAPINIALVGNPNSGKSSLFNALTGLNQKVGNFPGVTVDKKTGTAQIAAGVTANIIDLPGTYSLYPKSADEYVTYDVLIDQNSADTPRLVIIVADASNLKRNLLFCSQIIDLKIPVIIGLTMMDIARKKGVEIDLDGLERELGVPVVAINPRKNKGVTEIKKVIDLAIRSQYRTPPRDFINNSALAKEVIDEVKSAVPGCKSDYGALHIAVNVEDLSFINNTQKQSIKTALQTHPFNKTKIQAEEIVQRYARIKHIMKATVVENDPLQKQLRSEKIDDLLLHRFWGYAILLVVMFLLFQSIFWLASYPMDWIEGSFGALSGWLSSTLPDNKVTDFFINGILAGISGFAVFIPQIMILFGLITILEDTGYMARISFLTDRLMRQVGLNGKSVMPLISGVACAVPAIMATRTIENKKERLITIMVTPLMSCSARLPIYTMMIALVIPDKHFGILGLQGLVMMGLYLLGFFMAIFIAALMKLFVRIKEKSYFIMELPVYRSPRWANVGTTMVEKAKIFVKDAGKVIVVISVVLWFLASYGPASRMQPVHQKYEPLLAKVDPKSEEAAVLNKEFQSARLSNSYAGMLGHSIEPAIRPLGFDWKIGIALITSFAAREVFVGTMATLYSVGEDPNNNNATLREKLSSATWPDGAPVYTLASGLSLMLFYAFAMQCMSTMAIVKRETKSWKYPAIQLLYMTSLAYICSFIIFNIFK